eukprot:1288516-Pyramimonas_sp.AAC.1
MSKPPEEEPPRPSAPPPTSTHIRARVQPCGCYGCQCGSKRLVCGPYGGQRGPSRHPCGHYGNRSVFTECAYCVELTGLGGWRGSPQVRAAVLSKDCAFSKEFSRGNFGVQGQLQVRPSPRKVRTYACTVHPGVYALQLRRAGPAQDPPHGFPVTHYLLKTPSNPPLQIVRVFCRCFLQHCAKRRAELSVNMNPHCKGKAKNAVESVFDVCFKDTAPFERLP